MSIRVEIGDDGTDPARLAAFWAGVLDREVLQVDGATEVRERPPLSAPSATPSAP